MAAMALAAGWAAGCGRERPETYQGYVEGEYVCVAPSAAGRIEWLGVERGDWVEEGAELFALDAESEEAGAMQAREQLAAAEATLADLRRGRRPEEISVLEAQLAGARAEAARAEADRKRDAEAARLAPGSVSAAQQDLTRAMAEAAEARTREIEGQLAVAALAARGDQIRAQEAQAEAARAALAQAEWRLGERRAKAPAAGRAQDVAYRKGEWVGAGRPVVRLLPPGNVKIRFYVPEERIGRWWVGQEVDVRVDGREPMRARVAYVSEEADYTPPVIYSNETKAKLVFMAEAMPAAGAEALHPGPPAQVAPR